MYITIKKEFRNATLQAEKYEVIETTGTLGDLNFLIADDKGNFALISVHKAMFAGYGDTNVEEDTNVERALIMEQIEALKTKVASLQGQVSALKGKKAE